MLFQTETVEKITQKCQTQSWTANAPTRLYAFTTFSTRSLTQNEKIQNGSNLCEPLNTLDT
jgi:hypothetical protein